MAGVVLDRMALACRHLDVALPLPGGVAASFGAACSARKVARDVSLELGKNACGLCCRWMLVFEFRADACLLDAGGCWSLSSEQMLACLMPVDAGL